MFSYQGNREVSNLTLHSEVPHAACIKKSQGIALTHGRRDIYLTTGKLSVRRIAEGWIAPLYKELTICQPNGLTVLTPARYTLRDESIVGRLGLASLVGCLRATDLRLYQPNELRLSSHHLAICLGMKADDECLALTNGWGTELAGRTDHR